MTELGAGFEEGLGLARRGRTCEASTARRSSNSNSAMSTSPPGAAAGSGDVTDSTPPSSTMRIVLVGARCAGTCGEPDRRAAPLTAAARNSMEAGQEAKSARTRARTSRQKKKPTQKMVCARTFNVTLSPRRRWTNRQRHGGAPAGTSADSNHEQADPGEPGRPQAVAAAAHPSGSSAEAAPPTREEKPPPKAGGNFVGRNCQRRVRGSAQRSGR